MNTFECIKNSSFICCFFVMIIFYWFFQSAARKMLCMTYSCCTPQHNAYNCIRDPYLLSFEITLTQSDSEIPMCHRVFIYLQPSSSFYRRHNTIKAFMYIHNEWFIEAYGMRGISIFITSFTSLTLLWILKVMMSIQTNAKGIYHYYCISILDIQKCINPLLFTTMNVKQKEKHLSSYKT